jgi:hypothetical protein
MVIAIARAIPKTNASLSGFGAISASWSQMMSLGRTLEGEPKEDM